MDRRRAVVMILGLVVCLALLGHWAMRSGDDGDAPVDASEAVVRGESDVASIAESADNAGPAPAATTDATVAKAASDSGIFKGRIINAATRQPVRAFELEFQPVRFMRDLPKPPFHAFEAKDGRFECRDLPAGLWTILVTARGYQRFELPDVTISSGKTSAEILIPLRPGYALQGRVFDESTDDAIAAANINFREADIGRYQGDFRNRPSTVSRQDGTFVLDGLPTGPVVITVFAENYVRREVDVVVGNKMAPVEIGLSTGAKISGYLAGSDGLTPVAGMISLVNLDENSGNGALTGPAGEFSFMRLSPGRYQLSGRSGALSATRELTLASNESLEGIVLAMHGGHAIRGIVSGLRPEDLWAANVSLFSESASGQSVETAIDRRGAYTLEGVAPGTVHVSFNVRGRGQIYKTVEMPDDSDLTLNVEFPRGSRLTGRITRGGKPLAGTSVQPDPVKKDTGLLIRETGSSASGEYELQDVPDGEYTLVIDTYRSPTVRVSGDTVFDVDIPSAQLAGRLLEQGGKVPVVGGTIHLWPAQPGSTRTTVGAQSDHFGQFAVRGLQPGDFVLSVYKPGYELYREPLAYGSPIPNMTINLRPARGVEIKVRDAVDGKAVSAVTAIEIIGGQPGIVMRLNLDQNGVGYLPGGLAGSSLKFSATGYAPAAITDWDGESFEMRMQRRTAATP